MGEREPPDPVLEAIVRVIKLTRRSLAFTAAAMLLAGCATPGPELRQNSNPAANFGSYRTFGFLSPLATDTAGYQSLLTARLKDATRRGMESKGYVYSESNPDLLVNFFVNIEDKQDIRTTPGMTYGGGYYGYRRGMYGGISTTQVETVNYKEGTLTIDVVDAKQKVLAWQSTAEGRISREARKDPGPRIDAVVAEMMAPLPAAAR